MQKPPLDPEVADTAPSDSVLTVYDEEHLITYLRLLDADAVGADWRDVARIVLHIDSARSIRSRPEGVRQPFIARQMDDGAWGTGSCYVVARWRNAQQRAALRGRLFCRIF